MSAIDGSAMLLKVGNGAQPTESFTTLGGLEVSELTISGTAVDTSDVSSGLWQQLMDVGGRRAVRLQADGRFSNSASEELMRGYAFSGEVFNAQLAFGNGDVASGAFVIANYQRRGEIRGVTHYAVSLESAGDISFISG